MNGEREHGDGHRRRAVRLVLALMLVIAATRGVLAQTAPGMREALSERAEYQAALRASSQEMHEVAASKFERLLQEEDLTRKEAMLVSERLVDALVRARLPQKARVALTLFNVPEAAFWKAQIDLIERKFVEAENGFEAYLAAGGTYAAHARLALGQVIIAQGRENTGRKEFKALVLHPDPAIARRARILSSESEVISGRSAVVLKRLGTARDDAETEFVKACAWLSTGNGKQAEVLLRRFLEGQVTLPTRLRDAAAVRLAEAYAVQPGRGRTAERVLIEFLDEHPDSDFVEQAFSVLRKTMAGDGDGLVKHLRAWSSEPQARKRHALALFYYGQWMLENGRTDEAVGLFEQFRAEHPGHAREGEALRALMTLYGAQRDDERVLELAKTWRARFGSGGDDTLDFLTGMVRHGRNEYRDAAELFEKSAAAATDPVQAQRALYNAGVSAFLGGEEKRFDLCIGQLRAPVAVPVGEDATPPPPPKAGEDQASRLMLERALHLAAQRDSAAEEALQAFLHQYPLHARAVEAYLALAELALLDLPARTKAAGQALNAADALPGLSDAWRERLAYTRVWWHEGAANLDGVVVAGRAFLEKWENSPLRDEVRMKIAQAHFRREDYVKAQEEFEALAEEHGDSPYAEVAMFFAGRAAMSQLTESGMEKAITLWEEVVSRNGPLTREAQHQQAVVKRRQGNHQDALLVIENLLSSPVGDMEERLGLLTEKGELLTLLARNDPKHLGEAARVFAGIIQDDEASRLWRARAGVLLARCLRAGGKVEEALEACSEVMEQGLAPAPGSPTPPQEHLWLYRAGFLAMDMMEGRGEWTAAAHLADRLAKAGGERAAEARQRATRLRLEHFLWDK